MILTEVIADDYKNIDSGLLLSYPFSQNMIFQDPFSWSFSSHALCVLQGAVVS